MNRKYVSYRYPLISFSPGIKLPALWSQMSSSKINNIAIQNTVVDDYKYSRVLVSALTPARSERAATTATLLCCAAADCVVCVVGGGRLEGRAPLSRLSVNCTNCIREVHCSRNRARGDSRTEACWVPHKYRGSG